MPSCKSARNSAQRAARSCADMTRNGQLNCRQLLEGSCAAQALNTFWIFEMRKLFHACCLRWELCTGGVGCDLATRNYLRKIFHCPPRRTHANTHTHTHTHAQHARTHTPHTTHSLSALSVPAAHVLLHLIFALLQPRLVWPPAMDAAIQVHHCRYGYTSSSLAGQDGGVSDGTVWYWWWW